MKFLSVIFAFAAAGMLSLSAATLAFRGGEILAAQLSTARPSISGEDPFAYPNDLDRKIYAALTVRMTPGRALSVYDYSLEAFGRPSPCVAIRAGSGSFQAGKWEYANPDAQSNYTLLFVLDGRQVGLQKVENLTLKANFPPPERAEQQVPFVTLGSRPFPTTVPADGIMQARQ